MAEPQKRKGVTGMTNERTDAPQERMTVKEAAVRVLAFSDHHTLHAIDTKETAIWREAMRVCAEAALSETGDRNAVLERAECAEAALAEVCNAAVQQQNDRGGLMAPWLQDAVMRARQYLNSTPRSAIGAPVVVSEDSLYAAHGFLDGVSRGIYASHSVAEKVIAELLRLHRELGASTDGGRKE